MSKKNFMRVKRDLYMRVKTQTHPLANSDKLKEICIYIKKDLYTCQKGSVNTSQDTDKATSKYTYPRRVDFREH